MGRVRSVRTADGQKILIAELARAEMATRQPKLAGEMLSWILFERTKIPAGEEKKSKHGSLANMCFSVIFDTCHVQPETFSLFSEEINLSDTFLI